MINKEKGKKSIFKVLKVIIINIVTVWNIYFLVHLIFFTDKFKKPYTNINIDEYLIHDIDQEQSDLLSTDEKTADFLYMVEFLNENYPLEHIDEQIYEINIEQKNYEYLQRIKNRKNDFEFFLY